MLRLKHSSIGYHKPLLSEANAELHLGDVCLLIGNNGTGKTTLIKSILGQQELLKGTILINGQEVPALSKKSVAEQISVVFSKASIPPNYTLVDLISLGKYIHYPYYFELNNPDKHEVESIIEQLQLSQYRKLPLNQLSDGNLQKAFIGRAMAQATPIIILDEPTTHLDEENKRMILNLLRELATEHHKLILFSSHDWRLARYFADKIWLIKDQKLHTGITEDILLQHPELKPPSHLHPDREKFLPQILAPESQRQLLLSFLQKLPYKDLSFTTFKYHDNIWEISTGKNQFKAVSFENMLSLIENIR